MSRYVLIITIFGVFYLLVVPIVSIWFTGRDLFSVGEVMTSFVWGGEVLFPNSTTIITIDRTTTATATWTW